MSFLLDSKMGSVNYLQKRRRKINMAGEELRFSSSLHVTLLLSPTRHEPLICLVTAHDSDKEMLLEILGMLEASTCVPNSIRVLKSTSLANITTNYIII